MCDKGDNMQSILTKKQTKVFGPKVYKQDGVTYKLTATVRYDDECGNGHNSFAITGEQYRKSENSRWVEDAFGCVHDDIAKHFPHLQPFLKFHGMTSEGPLYYIENTRHHVLEHGPKSAWVYYTHAPDPLGIRDAKEECIGYVDRAVAEKAEGKPGYIVQWDEKSSKTRNLDYARSCAVWPDATDDDLTAPGLEARLRERLPAIMKEFQEALRTLNLVF
jgi:uncharacterized protein Usg